MPIMLRFYVYLVLSLSAVNVYADNQATALLERANLAVKDLNYDGVFALQTGEILQSIRIIHRAATQGEVERLVSLSGVERELIRTDDRVVCVYPEGEKVQSNHQPLGRGFPGDFLTRLRTAMPYYDEVLGRKGRVAGHQAQEVKILPLDKYRYGYRLWLARDNALLLQSDLIAEDGHVLEKFSFSSIVIGNDIPDSLFKPKMEGNTMAWKRVKSKMNKVDKAEIKSNWQVVWLPEGFDLVAHQNRIKANNGVAIEQRVYSDGLSSISVFIEKIRAKVHHLHGGSKMGAVNAFGSIVKAHFVTVVGEVPAQTVEKVNTSIRYIGNE
jgi:sigma-E factor negative regulatory protein RseB